MEAATLAQAWMLLIDLLLIWLYGTTSQQYIVTLCWLKQRCWIRRVDNLACVSEPECGTSLHDLRKLICALSSALYCVVTSLMVSVIRPLRWFGLSRATIGSTLFKASLWERERSRGRGCLVRKDLTGAEASVIFCPNRNWYLYASVSVIDNRPWCDLQSTWSS